MRTCGTCRLCCKAMGVPALDKPAGVWCPHAGDHPGGGCSIYEDRPAACREFNCSWLLDEKGLFKDSDRPDRIGVVFHAMEDMAVHPETGERRPVIIAVERDQGAALRNARARQIIEALRRMGLLVSVSRGEHVWPVKLTMEGRLVLGQPGETY